MRRRSRDPNEVSKQLSVVSHGHGERKARLRDWIIFEQLAINEEKELPFVW
jgi:hypothetical protein